MIIDKFFGNYYTLELLTYRIFHIAYVIARLHSQCWSTSSGRAIAGILRSLNMQIRLAQLHGAQTFIRRIIEMAAWTDGVIGVQVTTRMQRLRCLQKLTFRAFYAAWD